MGRRIVYPPLHIRKSDVLCSLDDESNELDAKSESLSYTFGVIVERIANDGPIRALNAEDHTGKSILLLLPGANSTYPLQDSDTRSFENELLGTCCNLELCRSSFHWLYWKSFFRLATSNVMLFDRYRCCRLMFAAQGVLKVVRYVRIAKRFNF
jgi:hypothetical protein